MTPVEHRSRSVYVLVLVLLTAGLVIAGVASLMVGASNQPVSHVLGAVWDGVRNLVTGAPYPTDGLHIIVLDLRLPRLVLAVLVGICLAVAGAVMQALFQNPMADPYLVGVSSGAGLGAVIAMMFTVPLSFLGLTTVPLAAFAGALGVVFLVYMLSRRGGRVQTGTLLLTGIAVGSLVSAVTSFLMLLGNQDLHGVLFWLLGGLSGRSWPHVLLILPQTILGLIGALALARPLNMLLLGDDVAASLGLGVQTHKRFLLILASLLAAGAVAVSGIIAFVGLIVPHIMRLLVGPDHHRLLPACACGGALLMVLSDLAARTLLAPTELPLGIITSALGCPFFLYLLSRQGRRGL